MNKARTFAFGYFIVILNGAKNPVELLRALLTVAQGDTAVLIMFEIVILFLIILMLGGVGWVLLGKKTKIGHLTKSLDMVLFSIRLPKYEQNEQGEKQDIKSAIGAMEQIFSNFLYLQKPKSIEKFKSGSSRIALEIASELGGKDISFYIAVPTYMEISLEKYIQGVYPGAAVEKVPQNYTIFEPESKISGSYLKQKKSFYFPLNTYKNLDSDPLSVITNSLSKIYPEEGAAIQIILKPSKLDIEEKGAKIISELNQGKNVKATIAEVSTGESSKFMKSFPSAISETISPPKNKDIPEKPEEKTIDQSAIEAIKAKTQKKIAVFLNNFFLFFLCLTLKLLN